MVSILTTLLFQKNIFQGGKDELHESFKKKEDKHFQIRKKIFNSCIRAAYSYTLKLSNQFIDKSDLWIQMEN